MSRLEQAVLIVSACALAWLLMSAVHEFGHVLGALLTGGRVERVVLHPLAISRTDVRPNPEPLVVAWAGPAVGVAIPLAMVATCWRLTRVVRDLVCFFAGVCLIANGLYLGVGSFFRVGDAGDLLRHGAAAWQLWLFGAVTVPPGLWLWNGTGATFGFGVARGRVSHRAAWICACLTLIIAAVELVLATDYALNGGASLAPDDFKVRLPGIWAATLGGPPAPGNPVRLVRYKDIQDGLSKTYLIGEKAVSSDQYTTGKDEGDMGHTFDCPRGSCVRFAKRLPSHDVRRAENCWNCHNFGSAHPTSWNAVFCDGSVHSLTYDISFATHAALASRAAGDKVNLGN